MMKEINSNDKIIIIKQLIFFNILYPKLAHNAQNILSKAYFYQV